VADLMQDAAGASGAVAHAITHEKAMSLFYRTLAGQCAIPRLRETFLALAVAEENHAQRLLALNQ
jgi:rubrerythrin